MVSMASVITGLGLRTCLLLVFSLPGYIQLELEMELEMA
jgi:hypothetical protein